VTIRAEVDPGTGLYHVVDDEAGPLQEANSFLEAIITRGLSPLTVRAYAFDLAQLYRFLTDTGRALTELDDLALLDFIRHERGRDAHPSSINRRLSTYRMLRQFWQPEASDAVVGASRPASYYRSPGRDRRIGMHVQKKKSRRVLSVKVPKKVITPLSAEQVREFLRGLRRYRDHAIVHLMLLGGLRSREVLGLERRDVSLLERRVRVVGKGDKERIVPLADLTATSLEQYLRYERPRDCADETLIVSLQGKSRGQTLKPSGLRSLFRRRRRKPVLANANPHRFRHTFGTDMARSGMSLAALQKLMGHENPEMTLQYINLSEADLAEAYHLAAAELQKRYAPDR
jgi:site-specific recombinase XerD